jgi:hypothetical protein
VEQALVVLDDNGSPIELYRPDPKLHQPEFHASECPNLLALGPRGTGKSTQLRFDAHIRCLVIPGFRALILRRTMPELRESHLNYIEREMALLGGQFLKTTFTAQFPNGSSISFRHCETEADVFNFLSAQYGLIVFDELSTFSLQQYLMISAACRAPKNAGYQAVIRAGSNPLGEGADWMYAWFVDHSVDPAAFPDYDPKNYQMIFSRLEDNDHLDVKAYKAKLGVLPEHIRKAWLLGERVDEGAYFDDFAKQKLVDLPVGSLWQGKPVVEGDTLQLVHWHTTPVLPRWRDADGSERPITDYSWFNIYRAIDWGYHPDPAVCLWIAMLPNKRAVVFKERTWKRTLAKDVAIDIKRESRGMRITESFCDPTMAIKEGQEYSMGELFEMNGIPVTPSKNDRILAGYAVHELLNTMINGRPQLSIVDAKGEYGCPNLVKTFPQLRRDQHDPRKIADGNDHYVIALAYFAMGMAQASRVSVAEAIPRWMRPKRAQPVPYYN